MFGISYKTWVSICEMYAKVHVNTHKSYLQWFPFSILSEKDWNTIKSQNFYEDYIQSGSFVLFPAAMHRSENYIQKSDGSFRDASLVSPVLFLVLQAIGYEVFKEFEISRPVGIDVFYAGNYENLRPRYKQDYDDFFKDINANIDSYEYFIKTDITSFFSNVNLDTLVNEIDKKANQYRQVFSPTQLRLFKELLSYCGKGRFPLIENSMASSYLATIVYLDDVDSRLYEFISSKISEFARFKIIRYVDDMYILFSMTAPGENPVTAYNQIRNEYSSLLKEYGLALNSKKCCCKESHEINAELKKSLYDELFNGEKHEIAELFPGALLEFLQDVYKNISEKGLGIEEYEQLIEDHFHDDGIEFTPGEVLNYFVYEDKPDDQTITSISESIVRLIKQDIAFISLDPKRLSVLVLKYGTDAGIKALLNQLFVRHRAGLWNSYDTSIAISYLIHSQFRHIDLIKVFEKRCPPLHEYYYYGCRSSFLSSLKNRKKNGIRTIIGDDWKTLYLFFMSRCEIQRHNMLEAFAYYKNYFDRLSADIAYYYQYDNNGKRPNYNRFYKKGELKNLYNVVEDSGQIIEKAAELRNMNPLAHASAELVDKETATKELEECMENLEIIVDKYRMLKQTV